MMIGVNSIGIHTKVSEFDVPALSIENLSKAFRGKKAKKALSGVSLTIEQGDFFGLLGPNGAGKSTLIGVLAKTVTPDSGSVSILGYDINQDWQRFKMAVGIVPQEITFDPFMSVWEALRLQSGYFGLRNNKKWIEELLEVLDLADKKKESVMRLSGGMKRRVLIAQALVHRPPLIVLDEPTAGVDINLRHSLWDFMEKLNKEGHTIILTTHYLEEAERLCRNVAMLNHGKIAACESTKTLLKEFSKDRVIFSLDQPLPADFPIACTQLPNGFYSANYESPDEVRLLLDQLHQRGLKPEGLELGQANLEEVFMRITQ